MDPGGIWNLDIVIDPDCYRRVPKGEAVRNRSQMSVSPLKAVQRRLKVSLKVVQIFDPSGVADQAFGNSRRDSFLRT